MNEIERQLEVILNGLEVNVSQASRSIGRATDRAAGAAMDSVGDAPDMANEMMVRLLEMQQAMRQPARLVGPVDAADLMQRLAEVHRETIAPVVESDTARMAEIYERIRRQMDDVIRVMNVVGKWPPPKPKP